MNDERKTGTGVMNQGPGKRSEVSEVYVRSALPSSPWIHHFAWPNLLTLFLIVPLLISYFTPFGDLDYTWQIRTGERIVQTGQLTPPESFSYPVAGWPVRQIEWLYEIILYGVWTVFGYGGLKLLRTLLITATLLLLAWRLRRERVASYGIILA